MWRLRLRHIETLQHYLQEVSTDVTMFDLPTNSRVLIAGASEIYPFFANARNSPLLATGYEWILAWNRTFYAAWISCYDCADCFSDARSLHRVLLSWCCKVPAPNFILIAAGKQGQKKGQARR